MKVIHLSYDDGTLTIGGNILKNDHLIFEFKKDIDPQDSGMGCEIKSFSLDWDQGQELFQFLKELDHYYYQD